MSNELNGFKMKKSYGLGVLLKLTKTYVNGIKICEEDGQWASNVGRSELCHAMEMTVRAHNINVKVE